MKRKGPVLKLCGVFAGMVLCAVLAQAQASAPKTDTGSRFLSQVKAISVGADTKSRGQAITSRLDELGIKYRVEDFKYGGQQGHNIVAELLPVTGANKHLMLGAHYDRVSEGEGVIDNASGSAAVLELLAALKERPLKNYAVSAAFFDLEEVGLRGSANYIKSRAVEKLPGVFINFDVFGYGDTLWVMTPDKKSVSALSIERAATASKFSFEIGAAYPPSDHLSFIRAKVETLSFSLVDGKEIKAILKIFNNEKPEAMPRILTIIHSANDTPDKIDDAAVARALPVVEQAIRLMDK